jgi:hypothetical protein
MPYRPLSMRQASSRNAPGVICLCPVTLLPNAAGESHSTVAACAAANHGRKIRLVAKLKVAECVPCSSHILNRRQQVDPFGYSSGRSRHRAPVRRTQRMPSRHARLDAEGRPRPSLRRLGSGNNGTNNVHCASLSNACRFFIQQAQQPARLPHKSPA